MKDEIGDIPFEIRKQWFEANPASKWPKIDQEDMDTPRSKKGRKPGPSKRVLNTSPEHYKWWRK